jgi:hypothetical protein
MSNTYTVIIKSASRGTMPISSGGNGELGGAIAARRITIAGTLQYSEYYGDFAGWKNAVSDKFKSNGWILEGLTLTNAGTILARESIAIRALIYNDMSLYEIKERAKATLEEMTNTRLGNTYPLFSEIQLEATGAEGSTYATDPNANKGGTSDFFGKLATTLGVSTPIAMVGGALLFVYLMKR